MRLFRHAPTTSSLYMFLQFNALLCVLGSAIGWILGAKGGYGIDLFGIGKQLTVSFDYICSAFMVIVGIFYLGNLTRIGHSGHNKPSGDDDESTELPEIVKIIGAAIIGVIVLVPALGLGNALELARKTEAWWHYLILMTVIILELYLWRCARIECESAALDKIELKHRLPRALTEKN